MSGTEIVLRDWNRHLDDQYVMLPDGSVRLPVDMPDYLWWRAWGHLYLGYYQVGDTRVDDARISTIFLGLDHDHGVNWIWNFRDIDAPPIKPPYYEPLIFETMIFGGEYDHFQRRYRSRDAARIGHADAVDWARAGYPEDSEP